MFSEVVIIRILLIFLSLLLLRVDANEVDFEFSQPVLDLSKKDELDFAEQLGAFRDGLYRIKEENGGELWLVLFAKFFSVSEQIRFNDPRWVFWDLENCEGAMSANRALIKGDIMNPLNWAVLASGFPDTFSLVADDWAANFDQDIPLVVDAIKKMLCRGGSAFLSASNDYSFEECMLSHQDKSIDFCEVIKGLDLSFSYVGGTPIGAGAGGTNLYDRLMRHVSESQQKELAAGLLSIGCEKDGKMKSARRFILSISQGWVPSAVLIDGACDGISAIKKHARFKPSSPIFSEKVCSLVLTKAP